MIRSSRFWLKTIETQHRVRVGSELAELLPWVNPDSESQTNCFGFLGAYGQLQIAPALPGALLRTKIDDSLSERAAKPEESSMEWARFARFTATAWPLVISFEKAANRFSLVLPKEPRDMGLVPSNGQIVVVAIRGMLELWMPEKLISHVQATSSTIETVMSLAADELENRS
jgi:hypothetical protein